VLLRGFKAQAQSFCVRDLSCMQFLPRDARLDHLI
jgi:hypothetical protein